MKELFSACHVKGILLPEGSLRYAECVSLFWDRYTCVATSLLARRNNDHIANISPTPDGFPETMIHI